MDIQPHVLRHARKDGRASRSLCVPTAFFARYQLATAG